MPTEEFHISKQVLDRFCVAGINYHKADAATRGMFAVSATEFATIADDARSAGIRSVFVVSTCNRTEIYGFAESVMQLVELLVNNTNGDKQALYESGYFKNGEFALQHVFNVAAGLDSQILGDYEISGQLKKAVELAKSYKVVGPVMDRLMSHVFQASKKIKTETNLSNGTVSVSYAVIELLQNTPRIGDKKILVLGGGKFGINVCKNLKTYLPRARVTIVNRTDSTAKAIAEMNDIDFAVYGEKEKALGDADIIIVCTNANEPTILPEFFNEHDQKLILDLSVPMNVHPLVKDIEGIKVIDVDEISTTILDKTLDMRKTEVPKAGTIIDTYINEFTNWLKEYHFSLHLKTWMHKLHQIDSFNTQFCEFFKDKELIDETEKVKKAQKAVKQLAVNLKVKNDKGCQFIKLINEYLQMS